MNTIFYFAPTMEDYREKINNREILARTIVFVEETQEIYKNGKLYPDISGIKKAINNASTKSWQDTVRAINELNNELREAFNASITDANTSLAEAQSKINEVKTILSTLTDSEGNALIDTDKANGLIELFAEYWNVDNQTYTNFENIWNAQAGKAGLTAEFVDTVNSKLTTYQNIVDIVNANKDEWIKFSDVANASETEISEEWDAAKANAIRKLKKVDTIDQKLTTIYEKWQIQEDGTSVWDTLNAQVTENTTALSGIQTLVNTEGALASLIAAYTDGDLTFLSDLKTHADGDESYFDLTAAKITGVLENDNDAKATIFGWVKDQQSGLRLSANQIFIGENLTLKDDLTEIRGLLHVADTVIVGTAPNPQILIDSTNGIKHTGGKFQINMDGSGFFGNENSKISWTPDGAITATGINIVGSSNVPEGWEDLVNTVSKLDGYSYLGNNGITFANDNDTVILSLADGLKHYKTADNTKSGYNLKNDGSGYVANGLIWWDAKGRTNIGSGANGLSWDENGNVTVGANLIVSNPDGGTPEDYDEVKERITELEDYKNSIMFLTSAGILIENCDTLNRVELATDNTGLLHSKLKKNEQEECVLDSTAKHGYAFYNDGHGSVANEFISWDTDGSGNIGGPNGIRWDTEGNLTLGSAVGGKSEYAYLTSTGILFNNTNDKVELKSPAGTNGGLIHTYKNENGQDTNNHGYALYNDGSGLVANNVIHWDNKGNLTIGYKSNDPEGPDNSLTWDKDGNLIIGANFIVQGPDYSQEFSDIDKALADLDQYNKSRAYITDSGIIIDNQNTLNRVTLATTDVGLIHQEIESYTEDGETKYRVKENGRSAYGFYNDGHGHVANGNITWGTDGSGNIGGADGISWDTDGNVTLGSLVLGKASSTGTGYDDTAISNRLKEIEEHYLDKDNYAYLTNVGILFNNQTDGNLVELSSASSKDASIGGLIHTYINIDGNTTTNPPTHGYALYNNGTGELANGVITWDQNGNGSIGIGDKKITWTSNGELVLGSGLIVGGDTTVVENPYDDTELKNAIAALKGYNTDRAYLKNTGILFENKTNGNLVGLTSVDPIDGTSVGGLIHTYIDANGDTTTNPPTHGYALYNDGTGSLADGYITWGTDTVNGQKKAWMKINGDEVKITYINNNTEVVKSFQEYINDKINLDPYITNDELQSALNTALNGVLKTGDLDGYLNSESLKNNAWLLQQIENLQGQIDVLDPNGESVDVNAIVEAYLQNNLTNEVNAVLGNTLNNYVLNETLQTTLLGYATKGELPDLTGYMKTDSLNMDFLIVAENKNYDPDDSEVEEKQHYLTDPQYVSTEGNYTNDLEKALKVTIAEMLSKIDKLAAYFIDENDKVHLLSSIGIDTQIHDYLTNDTAYSGLINWANGILGGVKSAGFTLNAFIAALSGSVWNEQTQKWESPTGINENTKEEVNITGIVDKFNSELRLDASQIVTGADGTNSSNVTLLAKLSDIEDALGNKAEASVVTGVSNRVQTIENSGYLTSSSDISDKVLGYLADNNLIKSDGNQGYILDEENIDLSNYTLKTEFTEAIAGLKSRIGNAESSIVSKTIQNKILRRHQLLDKQLNETITNSEQVELTQIQADLTRLAELLDDSTILNDIESRKQLLAKLESDGELTQQEQIALDYYNDTSLSEYDTLVETYGDDPELYNTYLESVIYNYISTSNKIQSKIDDEVASIETLVTKDSNGNLESTVNISANQINIGNMTLTSKLDTIEGNLLVDGEVAAKSLYSTQNSYHVEIQNGIIEGYKKQSENDTPVSIYKFNNDGSGHIGSNFSWDSTGNVTLTGLVAESVQTSKNNFHVDVMDGYIKGYTTNNEDLPSYYFKNDGGGSLAYGNITWDTLDLNITVGEHSIIQFLEKINSSNQNANVNPLYFTNGGNTYNGYELSNLGFVLYHGANNGGYETVLSSEGFKVFKHSENGVYNTQLELTPYGTGILANGNITWGFSDETLELSLTGNINLVNNSTNIVINERDLQSVIENGESTLEFTAGNDSVDAYTGELTIGDQTLTFINGILIQV